MTDLAALRAEIEGLPAVLITERDGQQFEWLDRDVILRALDRYAAEPLDVERLEQAMRNNLLRSGDPYEGLFAGDAEDIAAEYARLAKP
jgi:hypothetical protein